MKIQGLISFSIFKIKFAYFSNVKVFFWGRNKDIKICVKKNWCYILTRTKVITVAHNLSANQFKYLENDNKVIMKIAHLI